MQEEVENRTLTLVVSGTKFTGRLMKAAITKYLAHRKEKKLQKQRSRDAPVKPQGKQTVKQLIGQNQGVSNIEITDPSIKEFEKIARKYGVDYAVKKDRSSSPPKYLIFFKGRDADALTAAFTEYTGKKVRKAEKSERPSVLAKVIYEPYRIKVLNTINFKKSMHYNPFAYIHSEKDILKLVTTLIANTKGEGKAGDDFLFYSYYPVRTGKRQGYRQKEKAEEGAANAVVDVHIALVVEHIEGAGYIDFKSRSDILGFLFFLFPEQVV